MKFISLRFVAGFLLAVSACSTHAQQYGYQIEERGPAFVRDQSDCEGYRKLAIPTIEKTEAQHLACLTANAKSSTPREEGTGACSIKECQGFHNRKALFQKHFDENFAKCQIRVMELQADAETERVRKEKREKDQKKRDAERDARYAEIEARHERREQEVIRRMDARERERNARDKRNVNKNID
jgi:hypothetical protein